jgi:hypothetical protein
MTPFGPVLAPPPAGMGAEAPSGSDPVGPEFPFPSSSSSSLDELASILF